MGIFFYFLPRLESRWIARFRKGGSKGCSKLARKMLAKARKILPYEAEYIIRGDLITYYRGKDNNWRLLWSRRMKGFAIMGKHATLFFRKPTSIFPAMLILHSNNEAMESVLKNIDMTYETIN
jgi:hypothetical protein